MAGSADFAAASSASNASVQLDAYRPATAGDSYRRQSGKTRRRRRRLNVVIVIANIVLIAALIALGVIIYGYWSETKVYDSIAESAYTGPAVEEIDDTTSLADMTVDWDALKAQNADTVAWVIMPGTSINYPVVQGESDQSYLYTDFNGNYGTVVHKGCIFLSQVNDGDFSDTSNYLFGHNMNDNSMFSHLREMTDQESFDASRTFYILTPTRNYRCRTISADVIANTDTEIIQPQFADSEDLRSYIDTLISNSTVAAPTDVDLDSVDKLFSLVTCGDDNATTRVVLTGAVVESATPVSLSGFSDEQANTNGGSLEDTAAQLEEQGTEVAAQADAESSSLDNAA